MTEIGIRTRTVLMAGILPPEVVEQMQRWGCIPREVEVQASSTLNEEKTAEMLRMALDSDAVTELRDTDLDIVKFYLENKQRARLYLPEGGDASYVEVFYCLTSLGEIVIPWQGENIRDLLLDNQSYLKPPGGAPVYFADVRDLYFGETKAFIVCQPAQR